MKHLFLPILVVFIAGCGRDEASKDARFKDSDFKELTDKLDVNKNKKTTLQVQSDWQAIRGSVVVWKGKVHDVKGRRGGKFEVFLVKSGRPTYKGYNVIVKSHDIGCEKLSRGDTIKVRGLLENYKSHPGNPVVFILGNGQLVE